MGEGKKHTESRKTVNTGGQEEESLEDKLRMNWAVLIVLRTLMVGAGRGGLVKVCERRERSFEVIYLTTG